MVESKAWNWEIVDKNDEDWNSPAPEVYYLCEYWKKKGFKEFLDVGCGFGRNSIFMAKNGFSVSTFDLSTYSVEMTKQKAKENGVVLKDIQVSDMLEMPYKDNRFDCLLAMNVISHTDKNGFDKILSEINRVLKPNGEAYFTIGSKESFWFNNTKCIYVDDWTKIRVEDGPEDGIPHFYIDDKDCLTLFNNFIIKQIKNERILTSYGNFSPHYHIWVKKQAEE